MWNPDASGQHAVVSQHKNEFAPSEVTNEKIADLGKNAEEKIDGGHFSRIFFWAQSAVRKLPTSKVL